MSRDGILSVRSLFVLQEIERRLIKMAAVGHLQVTFLLTWSCDCTEQYATFCKLSFFQVHSFL